MENYDQTNTDGTTETFPIIPLQSSLNIQKSEEENLTSTVISSFENINYENVKEYVLYVGDDASETLLDISSLCFYGSTKNEFVKDSDKSYLFNANWYISKTDAIDTKFKNINFNIDTSVTGTYDIYGEIICPEGFTFNENIETPIPHVTVKVKEKESLKEITVLNNRGFYSLISPEICKLNDKNYINFINGINNTTWCGFTENLEDEVDLLISWDFSKVDINKEGIYEVNITLSLPEDKKDSFFISDDLAKYKKTVYVSDENKFELYSTIIFNDKFLLSFIKNVDYKNIKTYYIKSNSSLDLDSLTKNDFIFCEDSNFISLNNEFVIIPRNKLELNTNYYFLFECNSEYSNIIHLIDNGSKIEFNYNQGNRDGGDSTEPKPDPPTTQRPPKLPLENGGENSHKGINSSGNNSNDNNPDAYENTINEITNTYTENKNDENIQKIEEYINETAVVEITNNQSKDFENKFFLKSTGNILKPKVEAQNSFTVPVYAKYVNNEETVLEEVTKDYTKISGDRLYYLINDYGEYVPFSHNDISVYIPSEFLKSLNLSGKNFLTVEIINNKKNIFTINISLDNKTINLSDKIKVTYPISENFKPDTIYINNKKTESEIISENGYANFSISTLGEVKLSEESNKKLSEKENISDTDITTKKTPLTFIALSSIAVIVIIAMLLKRKV